MKRLVCRWETDIHMKTRGAADHNTNDVFQLVYDLTHDPAGKP